MPAARSPICTPVLLGVCVRRWSFIGCRKDQPDDIRILLFSATTPLLFFAMVGNARRVEANWPMFAYFPAIMLFAIYLAENWGKRRVFSGPNCHHRGRRATVVIAASRTGLEDVPEDRFSPQWDNLFGWRDLAVKEIEPLRLDSPVFTADYEYAAELSFYLPNQPEVRPLADPTRPTAFDFFGDAASPQSFDRVVLVRRAAQGVRSPAGLAGAGRDFDIVNVQDPSQFKPKSAGKFAGA